VLTDFTPDAFAAGIVDVLTHPENAKIMGARARKAAETGLAWSHIIDELERAYAYACARGDRTT
jgi:glycosyltransferase involved in cell wall biosynthesis